MRALSVLLLAACDQGAVSVDHGLCDAMINCSSAATPSATANLVQEYGAHGSCWADPAYADACRQACATSLQMFHDAYPNQAACGIPTTMSNNNNSSNSNDVAADAACDHFVQVLCDQLDKCAPFSIKMQFGDKPTCQSRMKPGCLNTLKDPGTTNTASRLDACVQKAQAQSCDDLFNHVVPDECRAMPGALADGAACGDDGQCQNAHCDKQGEVCGVCRQRASCNYDVDCASGSICSVGKCVQRVSRGGSCASEEPCAYGLACDGTTCQPVREAGQSCTETIQGGNCDSTQGDYCDLDTKICGVSVLADIGQKCGPDGGSWWISCVAGAACSNNLCVAVPADGDPCNPDIGCLAPARCTNSRCVMPDTSTCK
jgi:hypothetical protein